MFVQCRHGNGGYGVRGCSKHTCMGLWLDRFSSTDTIMVPQSAVLTFDPNPGLWR